MALYVWNSAPVPGTDISRSLIVTGREFHFPIDFSARKHLSLTSSPDKVTEFAVSQAQLLTACRLIARELVHHHRAYHRELINSRRPSPRVYEPGDRVFSRRAIRSDKRRGIVAKVANPYTGPWEITDKLHGGSYKLRHAHFPSRNEKRHSAHMSPFPAQLIPFEPVDSVDNRFGQIHVPIGKDPYSSACIQGFQPYQPFQVAEGTAVLSVTLVDTTFPSLAELNDELFDWEPGEADRVLSDSDLYTPIEVYEASIIQPGPQRDPLPMPLAVPATPSLAELSASIVASRHRLFFISHRLPGSITSEWSLVRVALSETLSCHPSAFQDGRFLVDFYIVHPGDRFFNAVNQRYWLEYHPCNENNSNAHQHTAHLLRPTDEAAQIASAENLRPFRQWVRLNHSDTYLSGPFDFAVLKGRQTVDRVPIAQWNLLTTYSSKFTNPIPPLALPCYTAHISHVLEAIEDERLEARFDACPDPSATDVITLHTDPILEIDPLSRSG